MKVLSCAAAFTLGFLLVSMCSLVSYVSRLEAENKEFKTALTLCAHTNWTIYKISPVGVERANVYYDLTVSSPTRTNTVTFKVPSVLIDQYPPSGDRNNPNADLINKCIHFCPKDPETGAKDASDFIGFKIDTN